MKLLLIFYEILPWLLNNWPAIAVCAVTFLLLFIEMKSKKQSRQKP